MTPGLHDELAKELNDWYEAALAAGEPCSLRRADVCADLARWIVDWLDARAE